MNTLAGPSLREDIPMAMLRSVAPSDGEPADYDRQHLALYAALLDADDAGTCWRETASSLMGLDPSASNAEACWHSHLERARWIVGDGLAKAIGAFGHRSEPTPLD
jgi:hypothetical protein